MVGQSPHSVNFYVNVLIFEIEGVQMAYSSREVIKMLEKDGWYLIGSRGDHHYYKHNMKSGKVTVPHPKKDLPKGTYNAILKQAGLK